MMSSEIVQDPQDLQPAPDEGPGLAGGVPGGAPVPGDAWRQELAEELIGRARSEGVQLTGPGSPNMRNGHSAKTVHTDAGPVRIAVPRDRAGSFEPLVVPKHARRVG